MDEHAFEVRVAAPAAETMALVGQFDLVADLSPQIATCLVDGEGVGATRSLTMSTGLAVVERLVEERPDGYAYALVEGPDGIASYRVDIRVTPDGPDACVVSWHLQLEMDPGRDPVTTVQVLQDLAQVGLSSARRQLERTPRGDWSG